MTDASDPVSAAGLFRAEALCQQRQRTSTDEPLLAAPRWAAWTSLLLLLGFVAGLTALALLPMSARSPGFAVVQLGTSPATAVCTGETQPQSLSLIALFPVTDQARWGEEAVVAMEVEGVTIPGARLRLLRASPRARQFDPEIRSLLASARVRLDRWSGVALIALASLEERERQTLQPALSMGSVPARLVRRSTALGAFVR